MGSDTGDGWCIECGDYFHLDDCGGYNPPCHKCGLCRGCCKCDEEKYEDEFGPDDGLDDEERNAIAAWRAGSAPSGPEREP